MPNHFGLVRQRDAKFNGQVRSASRQIDAIAQKHGADFICASPPGSDLLGWFEGPNRGEPSDGNLCREVIGAVKAAGFGWLWPEEQATTIPTLCLEGY